MEKLECGRIVESNPVENKVTIKELIQTEARRPKTKLQSSGF